MFCLILPDRLQHHRAGGGLGLTWQASGPLLSSKVLPVPVLLSVQAQGDVFVDDPSPPHVLNLFRQWCRGKLKTLWIPFPSMAETRKPTENPISSCELGCFIVTWYKQVNAHMPVNVFWVRTLSLLCAVLWYTFACAAKTFICYISEHEELLFCGGIFWDRILLFYWKCERNCNIYGAKNILLYALSTSCFFH